MLQVARLVYWTSHVGTAEGAGATRGPSGVLDQLHGACIRQLTAADECGSGQGGACRPGVLWPLPRQLPPCWPVLRPSLPHKFFQKKDNDVMCVFSVIKSWASAALAMKAQQFQERKSRGGGGGREEEEEEAAGVWVVGRVLMAVQVVERCGLHWCVHA